MNLKKVRRSAYKLDKKYKKKTFFDRYKALCFKILGKNFHEKGNEYDKIRDKLIMADMHLTPAVYLSMVIITTLLSTTLSFLAFFTLFTLIQITNGMLYTIGLTAIVGISTAAFFPFVISSKISNRRTHIEQDIPFILSELSILATTGLSPIRIFRNMSKRHKGTATNSEFRKVIYKIDIDGKDIITSISETAKESPSPTLREVLWDIANMIHQGGDLDEFLKNKADTTMQLKRDLQKEFIDKLGTYLEVYISLILVGILLLGIGIFILDAMGTQVMGMKSETLLMLLAFGFIPLSTIVINIMVNMAYSKEG